MQRRGQHNRCMPARGLTASATLACLLIAACGGSAPADSPRLASGAAPTPTTSAAAIPVARASASATLRDWPEFGLDPQRSDVSEAPTGITPANVTRLRHTTVRLPGTVDSSPIYLH